MLFRPTNNEPKLEIPRYGRGGTKHKILPDRPSTTLPETNKLSNNLQNPISKNLPHRQVSSANVTPNTNHQTPTFNDLNPLPKRTGSGLAMPYSESSKTNDFSLDDSWSKNLSKAFKNREDMKSLKNEHENIRPNKNSENLDHSDKFNKESRTSSNRKIKNPPLIKEKEPENKYLADPSILFNELSDYREQADVNAQNLYSMQDFINNREKYFEDFKTYFSEYSMLERKFDHIRQESSQSSNSKLLKSYKNLLNEQFISEHKKCSDLNAKLKVMRNIFNQFFNEGYKYTNGHD